MALSITNWNFSDLTGLVSQWWGWYRNVPAWWTAPWDGGAYSNQYVIYTIWWNKLNLDHTWQLSQSLWTVVSGWEIVTVSFDYADYWNGGYYSANQDMCTIVLYDTTLGTALDTKTVKNIASLWTFTTNTVSATCTVGNTLEIRFTALLGTWVNTWYATALDNVSVSTVASANSNFFAFL